MPLLPVLAFALIQGLTEPLPLSATAHLAWLQRLLGNQGPAPALLLAASLGVALALALAVWPSLWRVLRGAVQLVRGRNRRSADRRLLFCFLLATLVSAAGFVLLERLAPPPPRSFAAIGWTSLAFGTALLVTDRMGLTIRRIEHLGTGDAVLLGLVQLAAVLPGASRSGAVMTAARLLGYERDEAAELALLLGIPAILGANLYWTVTGEWRAALSWNAETAIALGVAFLAALVATAALLGWLKRRSFAPFALYRLALGAATLLFVAYR